MNLFDEICDFIERTQVFADNHGWQGQVLRFDSYRELKPPYGTTRSRDFIAELVRECWDRQLRDGQWAMVALLRFVGSAGGQNHQYQADVLIMRWQEEHTLHSSQPTNFKLIPPVHNSRRWLFGGVSLILVATLISALIIIFHPLGAIGLGPNTAEDYSAVHPGPGCDTNGGIWTPQGIDNIRCDTELDIHNGPARGYLYLQLPNNEAFASNNRLGVASVSNNVNENGNCIGLAEQGASIGYLGEFCDNGKWFIYSIANTGVITHILTQNVTSTRKTSELGLSLNGNKLSLSIDSEVHTINISSIQPIKVAITYFLAGSGCCYSATITVNNFSYTAL
jgi:hypothetical protein